jgi:hypothetical protein
VDDNDTNPAPPPPEALEVLACIEHQRWAHWQRYLHSNSDRQPDGSLRIPRNLVERWEKQLSTPYDQLREDEKESDREQIRKT